METDNNSKEIKGVEAIVIQNGNIVLGMQQSKRWYNLENGERGVLIKTLGGKIEEEDENSSKKALIREIFEEVKGIRENDIRVTTNPIFTKKIKMGDLNIFDRDSNIKMEADFYYLDILSKDNIEPNDLPALIKIPVKEFLELDFNKKESIKKLTQYVIKNKKNNIPLPEHYSLMIPKALFRIGIQE